MRALVLLVVTGVFPSVLHARDGEVIAPACAHPADLEDRLPGQGGYPGDYIVFTPETDAPAAVATLQERYRWAAFRRGKWWTGLDAVSVVLPVLTPADIAALRCEAVVELVVRDLGPRPPPDPQERPASQVELGVGLTPVSVEEAAGRTPRGMLVTGVFSGSVASRAHIQAGDLIVKFDDRDVDSVQDLWTPISRKSPGDVASLVILRNGARVTVVVQF